MQMPPKNTGVKNTTFQRSSNDIKGFTFYHATVCGYSSCLCTTSHYHCQDCGFGSSEFPHVIAHKNNCSGCLVQSNYGRSVSAENSHPQVPPLLSSSTSNTQISDKSHVGAYSSYGSCGLDMPVSMGSVSQPSTLDAPSNSSGHYFHRGGLQQSTVFNPLLANQSQTLYNGVFTTQTSFPNQNSYSLSGFNSYGPVDSPWLADNRIPPSNTSDLSRGCRPPYLEKGPMCSPQGGPRTCCSARVSIPESIGLCSPLSSEAYKVVTKEIANFQPKSSVSLESPNWFCPQAGIGYNPQQNQNLQQPAHCKRTEEFPPCSVAQMNVLLHEQNNLKQSNSNSSFTSQSLCNGLPKESSKPSCLQQNGSRVAKYCSLQKQDLEQPSQHLVQPKEQTYNQSAMFSCSSGDLHEDAMYAQASHMLHMDSVRSQAHFIPQKHEPHQSKPFPAMPGHIPMLQYQEQAEMIENCLQLETKSISNLHNNLAGMNNCCQATADHNSHINLHNNVSSFAVHHQPGTMALLPNCAIAGNDTISTLNQSELPPNDKEAKENSILESSSVAGESDIIVEETEEEEVEDLSESEISIEEFNKNPPKIEECFRCLVCDVPAKSKKFINHFVIINGDLPVTTMTCIPVTTKLAQVVPHHFQQYLKFHTNYMCRRCLNLIDSVDCLESKLVSVKQDLVQLFGNRVASLRDMQNWKQLENKETDNCDNRSKEDGKDDHTDNSDRVTEVVVNSSTELEEATTMVSSTIHSSNIMVVKEDKIDKKQKMGNNLTLGNQYFDDSDEKYHCHVCNKNFSSQDYLTNHKQQHTKLFSFYCDRCGKGFMLQRGLENHLALHLGELRYQCEICGKRYIQRYSLDCHLRKHEGNYRLSCSHCGKGFMCNNALRIHVRIHTGERPFICQHCGKRFGSDSNLTTHVRICSGNLPFKCETCGKNFALNTQLQTHILTIHEGKYRFKCTICSKGFIKESDQKIHVRTHSGKKPHKCETCKKCYTNLGNLNQHMKKHDKDLPFKCTMCGKGFLRKNTLAGHMNQHSGTRPYQCHRCEKSFASRRNLHAHGKWHDGKKKCHTCAVCGKCFSQGLQVHMRSHSGHRPYKCSHCDMAFSVKSTLDKHVRSKHKAPS